MQRDTFLERAGLIKRGEGQRKVRMEDIPFNGIPEARGLGFINSALLLILSN